MVQLQVARASDAPAILTLRDDVARWQETRGVPGWRPGEVSLAQIEAQVTAGEWHVLHDGDGGLIAALRLLLDDPVMWGARPPDSVYVHGLMVARTHAGRGLGHALLDWAEQQALTMGRGHIRLDCIEDNPALVAYYTQLGFRRLGRRPLPPPWHSVALFEKRIAPAPTSSTIPRPPAPY
jgi:GNAT superfamily N-acetyltransferase